MSDTATREERRSALDEFAASMREENDKFIAVVREFVSNVAGREAEGERGA